MPGRRQASNHVGRRRIVGSYDSIRYSIHQLRKEPYYNLLIQILVVYCLRAKRRVGTN